MKHTKPAVSKTDDEQMLGTALGGKKTCDEGGPDNLMESGSSGQRDERTNPMEAASHDEDAKSSNGDMVDEDDTVQRSKVEASRRQIRAESEDSVIITHVQAKVPLVIDLCDSPGTTHASPLPSLDDHDWDSDALDTNASTPMSMKRRIKKVHPELYPELSPQTPNMKGRRPRREALSPYYIYEDRISPDTMARVQAASRRLHDATGSIPDTRAAGMAAKSGRLLKSPFLDGGKSMSVPGDKEALSLLSLILSGFPKPAILESHFPNSHPTFIPWISDARAGRNIDKDEEVDHSSKPTVIDLASPVVKRWQTPEDHSSRRPKRPRTI